MGIPVFFKTCIENYQDICTKPVSNNHDNLFLDLNCLIHPCCSDETDEGKMINNILDKIELVFNLVKPKKIFYIAIDGPCPKPKMIQQRTRRFKSANLNKKWDTNAITPGTVFMEKLESAILKNISKFKSNQVIFSGCYQVGEGEHKIFDYIKSNKLNNNVVYGLDADLIMLSLISKSTNSCLLRETTEYNIENIDSEYIYLHIDNLKNQIIKNIKPTVYIYDDDQIIYDYIFICFLLGNDFVINTPSINLRYGGLDIITDCFKLICNEKNGDFNIVDLKDTNFINRNNFKYFIYHLYLQEQKNMSNIMKIRKNQERKYTRIYNSSNDKSELDNHKPIIFRDKEKQLFSDLDKWRENYYMYTLFNDKYDKSKKQELETSIEKMTYNYIQSLYWTIRYYLKPCDCWRFGYDFNVAPSLKDIYNLLNKDIYIILEPDNNPYTPEQQLLYVLPKKSHNLIRNKIEVDEIMYPKNPQCCYLLKRYLWEEYLILPKI